MVETEYFKVLGPNRMPHHGGQGQWPLRKWLKVEGKLVPCSNGLHVCTIDQLIQWLGPNIWSVEIKVDELINDSNKCVVREARLIKKLNWNEKNARLFAADCAEHVLSIYENKYPNDLRPREAIQMARSVALGRIKLDSAVRSAAYSAARSAAYSAARSAAYSAADSAADSAARSAAYSAARSAVRSAADSAAYSAADSAADSAARSAARSAVRSAARSAAYSAARSAVRSAADSAERQWQAQLLHKYLFGEVDEKKV